MMSLISGVYDTYWESREVSFLLIGCSNAGKTSLLERLKVTAWDNYSRISEESLLQVNSDMNKSSSARTSVQLLDPHGRFHQDILLQQSHSQSCNSSVIRRTPIDPTRLSNNRNDANDVQYDLKHGKRMLPPHLIRPTIGMNLAKFRAFGFHIKVISLSFTHALVYDYAYVCVLKSYLEFPTHR
jgi:GTPase SAR1 family protein